MVILDKNVIVYVLFKCDGGCDKESGNCFKCKTRYWGSDCNKICSNYCKGDCLKDNGNCINCPEGLWGPECLNKCPTKCEGLCDLNGKCNKCKEGFWGDDCSKKCADNCDGGCDIATQQCSKCKEGFWGEICTKTCPLNCESGCNSNGKCLKCRGKFWGEECNTPCNDKCLQQCEFKNGNCLACEKGLYGFTCDKKCNEGCDLELNNCDIDNGLCLCKNDYWNFTCDKKCSPKCLPLEGRICNKDDGKCTECPGNNAGLECEECKDGFYGTDCQDRCEGCLFGCNRDGICRGFACNAGNYYGIKCSKCSSICERESCDKFSGECSECKDLNKWGKECELNCAQGCKFIECCSTENYPKVSFSPKNDEIEICLGDSKCFYSTYDITSRIPLIIPDKEIIVNGKVQVNDFYSSTTKVQVRHDSDAFEYDDWLYIGTRYRDSLKVGESSVNIEFILAESAKNSKTDEIKPFIGLGKDSEFILMLFSNHMIEKDIMVMSRDYAITIGDYPESIKNNINMITFLDYDPDLRKIIEKTYGISVSSITEGYYSDFQIKLDKKNKSNFVFNRNLLSFFKHKFFGINSNCSQEPDKDYAFVCPKDLDISKLPNLKLILGKTVYTFNPTQFFRENDGYVFIPIFSEKTIITLGYDNLKYYDLVFSDKSVSLYNDKLERFEAELIPLPETFEETSYGGIIALLIILVVLVLLVVGYLLYKKYRFHNYELSAPMVE